jgi:transcription elongation factor GreA
LLLSCVDLEKRIFSQGKEVKEFFGECMKMAKQIQVTKQGFEALGKELEELLKRRPKLVERLERARNEGDLAENCDYTSAREELEFLDGRIDELKHVIDTASVMATKTSNGKVCVGAKVTVKTNGDRVMFHIVGEWEADPASKKISHKSPLGRALRGKGVGEKVEVEAPAGKVVYEIVKVE